MTPWEKEGISRATWYRRRPISEIGGNVQSRTIAKMRERIAQLEAEKASQAAQIAGLTAERNALQAQILEMKQKLVGVKWP